MASTTLNSILYLVKNIRMDRGMNNVLSYSESQMLSLCTSNLVASSTKFSFIRSSRNVVRTNFTYSQCLAANYIAFQNPEYDDKWFFAWIDGDPVYISDGVTELHFTVDAWSTWYDYFPKQACMVLREHVSTDTYGDNRQPEPIQISDNYMDIGSTFYNLASNGMGVSGIATGGSSGEYTVSNNGATYFGLTRLKIKSTASILSNLLSMREDYTGNEYGTEILNLYNYPSWLDGCKADENYVDSTSSSTDTVTYKTTTFGHGASNLHSYHNVKTMQYPYCRCIFTNGCETQEYSFEDFDTSSEGVATFEIDGQLFPQPEIIAYPVGYRGREYYKQAAIHSIELPQIPIAIDSYQAWLNVNQSFTNFQYLASMFSGALSVGSSIASAAVAGGRAASATKASDVMKYTDSASNSSIGAVNGAVGLASTVAGYLQNRKAARAAADTPKGGIPSGNAILLANNPIGFEIIQQTLYEDELETIDDYFDKFGYAINKIKIPNYTGRTYWNYVQIGDVLANGPVPTSYMEQINEVLNRGVTIWHSHGNIGNFALDNSL